jgi:hypothetical protein
MVALPSRYSRDILRVVFVSSLDGRAGMITEAPPVARKRSEGGKERRKSPDPEPRAVLFSVRGRPSWHEWLKRLADYDRSSVVEVLDRAAARYAKLIGFEEPPPER